ncbi:MAG: ABC transporter permease subunit [Thermodesulfobacteriota bacterium]
MAQTHASGPKQTRRAVLVADKVADKVISIGGVLVIAAVLGMMVFLVSEAIPLFKGGRVAAHDRYTVKKADSPVVGLSVDEFKTIAARVDRSGLVTAWHAATGAPIKSPSFDLGSKAVTASAQAIDSRYIAFGFEDGTVRFGTVEQKTEVMNRRDLPSGLTNLNERDSTDGTAVFSFIPGNQIRKTWIELQLEDPIAVSPSARPIVAMDYRFSRFGERPVKVLAAIDDQGAGTLLKAESKLNLFTRKVKTDVEKTDLPQLENGAEIGHALVNELASSVYFAEKSGKVYRFNTRDVSDIQLAETAKVTPDGVDLNVFRYLAGEGSIVVGGSDGSVSIFFLLRRDDATTPDGSVLVKTRVFAPQPAAVVAFSPGQQSKMFATADAAGGVWVRYGTSTDTLVKIRRSAVDSKSAERILLSPRGDGLLSVNAAGAADLWELDIPHPESSLRTLFGKVWYEDYPEPSYTWQSTGATDAFEPKLSLVPLIFGTLKATFYSLLFAIPIALLAAIYTSEFVSPDVRGKIKPVIEVMASVPSVVMGFVAALVLAPIVESWIAAVLLAFVALPCSMIVAAYLWQLLPPPLALRMQGLPKLTVMFVVVLAGIYAAYSLGPTFEWFFFDGNFRAWANGDRGGGAPFYFMLLVPVVAIGVSVAASRLFGARFSAYMKQVPPFAAAALDLARWLGIAFVTIASSYLLAVGLQTLGFDPRGGFVGTYVQRNTLIVGFAMGFAVIPIIYTLAEDALNAVPEHLRAASLACGATLWQTAIWIILPTAVSGVFSAVMIGMGRAVGETMIVVMAAGNTPLMDMNVFNGLRALSANIAVELPEAPKDATLYRVLFLTGLVLFAMTFVINTVAEIVRLRFRKRSMQL